MEFCAAVNDDDAFRESWNARVGKYGELASRERVDYAAQCVYRCAVGGKRDGQA